MTIPALTLNFVSKRIFTIHEFLTPVECTKLIEMAEKEGFSAANVRTGKGQKAMPMLRNNDRVIVKAGPWQSALWNRLARLGLPQIDGQSAIGLPEQFRFYRYESGQRFKMHKDGPWKERGLTSKLTFLVYLNQEYKGGRTDFRDVVIEPVTGMGLLFVHDTWHEGVEVTEGVKYVLRSDVMYA